LVGTCFASPLAEDSTLFSTYWQLLDRGNTAEAGAFLRNLNDTASVPKAGLVRFFMAWQALHDRKVDSVRVILQRGFPTELTDHARWLEAQANLQSGNTPAAIPFLEAIAGDTCSIFNADAVYHLGLIAHETEDSERLDSLIQNLRKLDAKPDRLQELIRLSADLLTEQNLYEAAVERLWEACLLLPASEEASTIRRILKKYSHKHGYIPRISTPSELQREFAAFEKAGANKAGLQRVQEFMQTSAGVGNADLLCAYKGRFESGLRRHKDAVATLKDHLRRFPQSPFRQQSLFYLGRSAYLRDQDSLAIASLSDAGQMRTNTALAARAWDVLGTLHLDRARPVEAVEAYRRCDSLSRGTETEADCLWKLAWAYWEANRFSEAADAWQRLAALNGRSDYTPGALYWCSRAEAKAERFAESAAIRADLLARFPYSYYSIIARKPSDSVRVQEQQLSIPTLDELWLSGGDHSRKFALLACLKLNDLALQEWPAAANEQTERDGFLWWKAQLHLWNGDRNNAHNVVRLNLSHYIRSAGSRPQYFDSLLYPLDYLNHIIDLSARNKLDPYYVMALICQESHFEHSAVSPVGAVGLAQLMPRTARSEARKLGLNYSQSKLRDPEYNLRLGTSYLAGLLADFAGDTVLALAAYNAGESAAQAWYEEFGDRERDVFIDQIPFRETRLFIKRNIEHKAAYRRLYADRIAASSPASVTP